MNRSIFYFELTLNIKGINVVKMRVFQQHYMRLLIKTFAIKYN